MMDAKNAIGDILRNATGNRTSGRDLLISEKKSILAPAAAVTLKEQWQSAGRDHARVVMMLSEHDGSNPHFVTGWDGRDTFVCFTESGLAYMDYRKLEKMKVESRWNPSTRLIEVRTHQLMEDQAEGMSGSEVEVLLDRIKRTLKKSNKKRRKGRLRNMEKFFSFDVVESNKFEARSSDTPFSGPLKGGTEFVPVKEKDDRIPEAPKDPSTTKLPKDAKSKQTHRESFNWRSRSAPAHPMMQENSTDPQMDKRELVHQDSEGKGGGTSATPGGNKTDPQSKLRQLVRMNREGKRYLENHTDPQLDKRELVDVDSEGGQWNQGGATPNGNKTDPQQRLRQLVRMHKDSGGYTEDKAMGAKDSSDKPEEPECTTYSGEKAKVNELSSRPKITVRHEAMGGDKAKKLFGPDSPKKAPMGAKKPLLMLVLMGKGKGKGKGKAPKRPMAEDTGTCTGCGKSFTIGANAKPWDPMSVASSKCSSCEAKDKTFKMKAKIGKPPTGFFGDKPKKSNTFESRLGRTGLNLVESKRRSPLANIAKIRNRARSR